MQDQLSIRPNCRINPQLMPLVRELEKLEGRLSRTTGASKVLVWRGVSLQKKPMAIELVIASALALRGAEATVVLCDGVASGCLLRSTELRHAVTDWPGTCQACHATGLAATGAARLPHRSLSRWVDRPRSAQLREIADAIAFDSIPSHRHDNVPVGLLALSSAERYFKGLGVNADETSQRIVREYLFSGLVNAEAAKGALEEINPSCIFMSHGIYVDWGPIFKQAPDKNIPVTRWRLSDLKNHLIFEQSREDGSGGISAIDQKDWEVLSQTPLEPWQDAVLDEYMRERSTGPRDRVKYQTCAPENQRYLREALNLPSDKQIWGIFSHLNWDDVFGSGERSTFHPTQWVIDTLTHVRNVKDVIWVIKIHPAERHFPVSKGIADFIRDFFPSLPSNVRLILPDADINTYGLLETLDGGVTILGTVGLELAMMSKPVILAGEAHYGGKGFTFDSVAKEQYLQYLERASSLPRLSPGQVSLARRYAFNYFIERQIPFDFVTGGEYLGSQEIALNFTSIEDLKPGKDSVLDMLCGGILSGGQMKLHGNEIQDRWGSTRLPPTSSYAGCPKPEGQDIGSGAGSLEDINRKGEELALARDFDSALKVLEGALAVQPDHAATHNNIGAIYLAVQRPREALKHFIKALEADPVDPDLLHNCAEVFKCHGLFDDEETNDLILRIFLLLACAP
jgi:tetratricopeptide (TPR) repeat protein